MFWAFRQLSIPMNYLRIRHGKGVFHSKVVYDFVLPLIFALFTCLSFWLVDVRLALFENQEMSKRIMDLLALMIVFYVAALAAVATFERKGIDEKLKGEDAVLWVRNHDEGGNYFKKRLTYRQFIS